MKIDIGFWIEMCVCVLLVSVTAFALTQWYGIRNEVAEFRKDLQYREESK